VGSGELRHRAEAAWLLGDLGIAAKPALPELTAIVEDEDEAISRAAVYPFPGLVSGGGFGGGMMSVKDAAIRALGEIGDESVVALLGGRTHATPAPASNGGFGQLVANSYNSAWVADAIEQLTGMRPQLTSRSLGAPWIWTIHNLSLARAYDIAFTNLLQDSYASEVLSVAQTLMPHSQQFERDEARLEIERSSRVSRTLELEMEIKLIKLLTAADDPKLVLESILTRWHRYIWHKDNNDNKWEPGMREAALAAYRELAVQIVHTSGDQQADVIERLIEFSGDRSWPACVVLVDILSELEPHQQAEAVVSTFQQIAGTTKFADVLDDLSKWLGDERHRHEIQQRLGELTGEDWESLVAGMFRAGLADGAVKQTLLTRFGDDSIRRSQTLQMLIHALDDQPDIARVIIELIEHPGLDAPATVIVSNSQRIENSFRAEILGNLTSVPTQHRSAFKPFLQKLVVSGKNGEPDAARRVLDAWK
jgi:hypothetical protein